MNSSRLVLLKVTLTVAGGGSKYYHCPHARFQIIGNEKYNIRLVLLELRSLPAEGTNLKSVPSPVREIPDGQVPERIMAHFEFQGLLQIWISQGIIQRHNDSQWTVCCAWRP